MYPHLAVSYPSDLNLSMVSRCALVFFQARPLAQLLQFWLSVGLPPLNTSPAGSKFVYP